MLCLEESRSLLRIEESIFLRLGLFCLLLLLLLEEEVDRFGGLARLGDLLDDDDDDDDLLVLEAEAADSEEGDLVTIAGC